MSAFVLLTMNAQAVNIVTNGNYENGLNSWNNVANDGGNASYSIKNAGAPEGSNYLEADIGFLGSNAWSVQSIHGGPASGLQVGKNYTLSFYAKCDQANKSLQMVLQNNVWQSAFNGTISTQWTQYSVNFTAQETNPILRIQYLDAAIFSIDDIQIDDQGVVVQPVNVSLQPEVQHQEMQGFGGAATWFIYRLENSNYRNTILDLLINDVGIDILRVKNWYYPANYPANKSTAIMEDWNENVSFRPTINVVNDARQMNADLKVLLCSWGPPVSLKSNNQAQEGTLSKNNGKFQYGALADYYNTMLDSIGFNPDWISFQNEPGYTNPNWRTCQWRPTETSNFPGYDKMMDTVWDRIQHRSNLPKIIGPEVENIGNAQWDNSQNSYRAFANAIKNKSYIEYYAYHLYNFYDPNLIHNTGVFNIVRDEFSTKPNIMTEYGGKSYNWLQEANLIQNTVIEAGTSGYIFWSLLWDGGSAADPNKNAMIRMANDGSWEITEDYYLIKHFSKYVDAGYKRVELTGNTATYKGSAYLSPDGSSVTLVLVNDKEVSQQVNFAMSPAWNITGQNAYQSTPNNYFQQISTDIENGITLPDSSITTITLDVQSLITDIATIEDGNISIFPNPGINTINVQSNVNIEELVIFDASGKDTRSLQVRSGDDIDVSHLSPGLYFMQFQVGNELHLKKFVKK